MSADAKLILCLAIPLIVTLTIALTVCLILLTLYRRRNETLERQCDKYRDTARETAMKLRRVQSAHYVAETQAAAEMADKDRELKVNRELMRQLDQSRKRKTQEAPA